MRAPRIGEIPRNDATVADAQGESGPAIRHIKDSDLAARFAQESFRAAGGINNGTDNRAMRVDAGTARALPASVPRPGAPNTVMVPSTPRTSACSLRETVFR